MRKIIVLPVALLCMALAIVGCGTINENLPTYEQTSIIRVGDIAPDFSVTLISGEDVTLAEVLNQQPLLLIFFSHTCPDCKALLDDMQEAKQHIDALGVRVLAISRGASVEEVETYFSDNGYQFDVAVDIDLSVYNLYATMYVPRTYLINSSGVVQYTTVEYSEDHIPNLIGMMATIAQ
jgi:peroxiredoxin